MAAQQVLVLFVQVRILVVQLEKSLKVMTFRDFSFSNKLFSKEISPLPLYSQSSLSHIHKNHSKNSVTKNRQFLLLALYDNLLAPICDASEIRKHCNIFNELQAACLCLRIEKRIFPDAETYVSARRTVRFTLEKHKNRHYF